MRLVAPSAAGSCRPTEATRARRLALFGLIALLSLAACTSHPRSASTVAGTPGTSAAAGRLSWVRRTYYGAGLAVTLTQPAGWTPRLAPQGFHYGATLAYLANFALRPYCRSTPETMTCDPRWVGAYPAGGRGHRERRGLRSGPDPQEPPLRRRLPGCRWRPASSEPPVRGCRLPGSRC